MERKMWKNGNTLKESRRPMREAKKNYYRGIKPFVYLYHGSYEDPEILDEVSGKIMNYWDIEDALWEDFKLDVEEGDFEVRSWEKEDDAFERYIRERRYLLAEYFGREDDAYIEWKSKQSRR